jgi:hypothetical protein
MHRARSNNQLLQGKEQSHSEPSGLRKISSNLMELLRNRPQQEQAYSKKKSSAKIEIYEGSAYESRKPPTPRSVHPHSERVFGIQQQTPPSNGKTGGQAYDRLLQAAGSLVHVKRDLGYLPRLQTTLDKTTASVAGLSIGSRESHFLNASIQEIRNMVEGAERQKYENVLTRQLVALLSALEVPNPEKLVTPETTIEFLAHEIRKRFPVDQRSPAISSRVIKKPSTSFIEEPEENQRELRRLKELVVKLQNESKEHMKKSTNERIKELYDDNQNYQRKIADLIDQLRRKEQDFLLIPIGKIAEERIDAVLAENAELKKQLEELKKKYDQDLGDFSALKNSISRTNNLFPSSNEVFLDPYLLLTVVEQKQALLESNELLITLRAERDQFQNCLKKNEIEKYELAKQVASIENQIAEAGFQVPDYHKTADDVSAVSIQETPRGISEERLELSHQLENLRTLKTQLNKIKEEITKSG